MKKFLLRHFPFNMLSYPAEPHFRKSIKPVLKSQSSQALLEVLSSQNGHYNRDIASQESNCSSKESGHVELIVDPEKIKLITKA
jgi:hypothetical protein